MLDGDCFAVNADGVNGVQKSDLNDFELPPPASSATGSLTWYQHMRRFSRFVGPTWLIAVTFVDPGGITGALQQGSETRFALLWISLWSIVFGYVFQLCQS